MHKVTYFRKQFHDRYASGEWAQAAALGEALLAEHHMNQVYEGTNYADDLFNLGRLYDDAGLLEKATALYTASAQIVMGELGESKAFAYRLNNLAALLHRRGRTEAAYHMYEHAADILRRTEDTENVEMADALYNLANAAAGFGKPSEALRWHKEALTLREAAGCTEDIVHSMHSLAFIYEQADARGQATRYARKAMEQAEGTADYFGACYYLAGLYEKAEQYEKARRLYETVLQWAEESGGRGGNAHITVKTRLSRTLAGLGEYRKALDLLCETRVEMEHRTDDWHLSYADCLRSMALLHRQLEEPDEAVALMMKAIRIKKRVMGEHLRDMATDAIFVIDLHITAGRTDEALAMLVYLLMQPDGAGPEETQNALARVCTKAGRKRFRSLLEAMASLNDREQLWHMMEEWIDWEARDD